MNEINLLRKLAQYQQYTELKDGAQSYWDESHDPAVIPLQALAAAHLGQHKQAHSLFKQAQQHQAEYDADTLVDIAGVLIVMQRIDEAIELLQSLNESLFLHSLGIARLAYCYMLQGKHGEAETAFKQSVELEPARIPVLMNLAGNYVLRSEVGQAQTVLSGASEVLQNSRDDYPEFVVAQYTHLIKLMQLQIWVAAEEFAMAEDWLQTQGVTNAEELIEESLTEEQLPEEQLHWVKQYARLLAERDYHDQATDILRDSLKQYPESSELCLQLAELAQVQGRFMPAVNLLRRAITKDKDNVALWVQLSNACLHRFDKQARNAAEKAVEIAEALEVDEENSLQVIAMKRAQAKNALAQVECQEQNFEVAETLFREILAEHEYFLPALQGLGQQLMQQGKIDEAVALFERVKTIDPVKGYSALINARQFPEDIETLERMEKAASMPSLEGKVRAGILFQLASAWEKRKDYEKAFELAKKANAASKKFLPYNGKTHRNQCYRTRVCFSKPLYEHRKDCGVDSSLPVYVLGMPRSGTTLVEQILAGHSQIFGAGELGVIPQVIQGLNRWERHTGSGRKYPDCVDDLTPYVVEGLASNILKELQEYDENAKHVVDKLPHNFENIGLIKFLFPNAKIISVRRDPRDIAMSNYFTDYQAKHGGMGFAYDLTDIGEQLADHNMMMHHWQETFPGEILEINYEDVVDNLEGSARKMLEYIGVEWESDVLKFNELDRTVKTASVWQVRQPIYKTSKAKWKRYEKHLAPLIAGTNANILPDPITDLITLPEPGFQVNGVALFKDGKLDEAERSFKKMLHHNPKHAASHYMLGLVYMSKNHPKEGIQAFEVALDACPWQKEWRENLIKAYESIGDTAKLAALEKKYTKKGVKVSSDEETLENDLSAFSSSSLEL